MLKRRGRMDIKDFCRYGAIFRRFYYTNDLMKLMKRVAAQAWLLQRNDSTSIYRSPGILLYLPFDSITFTLGTETIAYDYDCCH